MSLSDLPDDILNLISIRLNGFDNCSLWMASDSKLRQRLVNTVFTDFHINYTTPGRFLWPGNFLKNLKRLSRLSLVVDQERVANIPIQNIELFPCDTLKSLKLNCYPSSKNDPVTGLLMNSNLQFVNLNQHFPNLEHLELGDQRLIGKISIELLRCLPQNLKSLSIPQDFRLPVRNEIGFTPVNMYFEALPQSLTVLDFGGFASGDQLLSLDLSKTFPNLTTLSINVPLDQNTYPTLPPSLTSLKLKHHDYNIGNLSAFLPSGLRNLTMFLNDAPENQSLSHLQHLEKLKVNLSQRQKKFITKCPPNLKTFNATSCGPQILEIAPFVHGITKICLNYIGKLEHDFVVALPRTVTHLSLYIEEFTNPFQFFELLPAQLRHFETDIHIIDKTSSLPENLTYLDLSPTSPFKSTCFDKLPQKLETLILMTDLPQSIFKELPASLKTLKLQSHLLTVDDQVISTLPRGLTSLTFRTYCNLSNASARLYPPNLQYLYLYGEENMTDEAIVQLPRSLTYLRISENPHFTDTCIKDMPSKLTELDLPHATKISWRCLKDLPKYLTSLDLQRCKDWKPNQSRKDLPEFLKYFTINISRN